jgi:deazaflavin-dependent oxidoreductase (nitroreductase family)
LDEAVRRALERDRTIDITTTGARTGQPRRIETWFYRVGGAIYLTGSPGRRGWYANLLASPAFTFHLKDSVTADLPAIARPVTDESERRRIMAEILADLNQPGDLEAWVAGSPLAEVVLSG